MNVLEIIKNRYSVRKYLDKDIENEKLKYILDSARFSQSAKNLQDWKFIVVREKETKVKIMSAARGQSFVSDASVIIVCCGVGTEYIMTCGQYSYSIDVSIAMENMVLAAYEKNIGTCWLGAFYEDQVKDILGIPQKGVRIVGILTLGYPATDRPKKFRKKISEIVSFEKW